jgi:hypothetical protein
MTIISNSSYNDSAFYGKFIQKVKNPFLDLKLFIYIHAFLCDMPIHHMHTLYSRWLGKVQAKLLCPNLTPMHSLFPMGKVNKTTTSLKTYGSVLQIIIPTWSLHNNLYSYVTTLTINFSTTTFTLVVIPSSLTFWSLLCLYYNKLDIPFLVDLQVNHCH